MLCIQLLFPTANFLSVRGGQLLPHLPWSLFQSRYLLANDPFLLKMAFFYSFKYIRFLAQESDCPVSFWEHRAWSSDSQVGT